MIHERPLSLLGMQTLYGLSVAALAGAIIALLFAPGGLYAEALLLPAIALFFGANLIGGLRIICGLIATTRTLNTIRSHSSL